jgi:glucan biosynthesis protein C
MAASSISTQRRYDLDWLRVLTILVVFIFHSARFFDEWGWHVKNFVVYEGVTDMNDFLTSWIMPIMFVISSASIYFALGKGGAGKFFKDKVLRLVVPLVVGMFTHGMWQVYLERVTKMEFTGTFWQFIPHYFTGIYPFTGNFSITGVHLWYLLALFLFCLIFYPLFHWLKGSGQGVLHRVGDLLAIPGGPYLLAIPTILLVSILDPDGIGFRDTGGWNLIPYISFFLPGFILVSHEKLQQRILKQRWISLVLGMVFGLAYLYQENPAFGSAEFILTSALFCLTAWSWIFAFMGFAMKRLTFTNPFLKYANEAVLPFYILHQPVLLTIGFYVVRMAMPDWARYAVIASTSFAAIMLIYELLVRRINVLRFLFGLRLLPKTAPAESRAPFAQLAK